jgi:hypothetical protein
MMMMRIMGMMMKTQRAFIVIFALGCFLASTSLGAPNKQMARHFEYDVDYPGNDISGFHLDSADACWDTCERAQSCCGCVLFVYGPDGMCWLKTAGDRQITSYGAIAGRMPIPPSNCTIL